MGITLSIVSPGRVEPAVGTAVLCTTALLAELGTEPSRQSSSQARASSARGVFRALASTWSGVLGPELGRCVRLILAKAVSEALAWARAGRAVPGGVSLGLDSTRPEPSRELPVPYTAPCETAVVSLQFTPWFSSFTLSLLRSSPPGVVVKLHIPFLTVISIFQPWALLPVSPPLPLLK